MKKEHNALNKSQVFEQTKQPLGETIEDMAIEKERKDINKEFLEKKKGSPEIEVIKEMNQLGSNNLSFKKR